MRIPTSFVELKAYPFLNISENLLKKISDRWNVISDPKRHRFFIIILYIFYY